MKTLLLITCALFFAACATVHETAENDILDEEILNSSGEPVVKVAAPAENTEAPVTEAKAAPEEDSIVAEEATPVEEPKVAEKPYKKEKSAMRVLKNSCEMRTIASVDEGAKIRSVKEGKKLWTEDKNAEFFKVYRKGGEGFLKKDCF